MGIDTAAHSGALDAGGVTVAVLAGGLDDPYPRDNAALFGRILASGGAVCSLQPDGTPPLRPLFIQRNRLIASAADVTVVIQASLRSGARSTAAAARRAGRPVAVVPMAPWDPRGAGCAAELMLGARPVSRAGDVWSLLRERCPEVPELGGEALSDAAGAPRRRVTPRLQGPVERALWAHLGDQPAHVDVLCERSGLTARQVLPALLTMALRAVVVEGPGGCYRRA